MNSLPNLEIRTFSNQSRRIPMNLRLSAILFALTCVTSTALAGQAVERAIPDAARPVPLPAVRLTGGPLKRAAASLGVSISETNSLSFNGLCVRSAADVSRPNAALML
jgi:hypothetical protein